MLTAEAAGDEALAVRAAECLRGWRGSLYSEISAESDGLERGCGCGGDGRVGVDEAIRGVGASGSLGMSALWLENNRVASSSTTTPRHPSRYPFFLPCNPLQNTMAAYVASGGGGNAAFKVHAAGLELRKHALTQAAGQGEAKGGTKRQYHCRKRYGASRAVLELHTDPRRAAVADAIRTVCSPTRCGDMQHTNLWAVSGTERHGQDGTGRSHVQKGILLTRARSKLAKARPSSQTTEPPCSTR
jgi:hypothetical protein